MLVWHLGYLAYDESDKELDEITEHSCGSFCLNCCDGSAPLFSAAAKFTRDVGVPQGAPAGQEMAR